MSRVLVVGGGSELQPRLRRVSAGVETVVLCRVSSLPHVYEQHENAAMVVLNDGCPTRRWVAAARAVQAEWAIDAVASFADLDQDKAAAIAADLGLPFHSAETVGAVQDKLRMRARLNGSGVEAVPFRAVDSAADLAAFCAETGPPVIVKPSRGWASAGVAVVRSTVDIPAAYHRAATADPPLFGSSPPMAERYYEGREFSVEAITQAGEHHVFAITEKVKDEVTKVELGHLVPARLEPAETAALIRHVRAALTALQITFGPTHTEVILAEAGPVIVETHLRDGGDEIPELVRDATGVELAEVFLRQVLGLPPLPGMDRRDGPRYSAAGAIRFLAVDRHGTLAGIDGWDAVRAMPGVQGAKQLLPEGAPLAGLTDSFARLGFVRVRADGAAEAVARADAAVAALTVRTAG